MRESNSKSQSVNKLHLLGVACLVLGIGVLYFYFQHSRDGSRSLEAPENIESVAGLSNDADSEDAKVASSEGISSPNLLSAESAPMGSNREGTAVSDKLKSDVLRFGGLFQKAVLTSEEESEMQELLKNRNLIGEVGQALRSQKLLDEAQFEELQSAGIDFLKQALQSGDEETIRDTIWDIIRDPQIEDSQIPVDDRKKMAIPKAELLFHATALRPDLFPDVEMDLPGPASKQIWQNVQQRQSDNLEESLEEAKKFEESQSP